MYCNNIITFEECFLILFYNMTDPQLAAIIWLVLEKRQIVQLYDESLK